MHPADTSRSTGYREPSPPPRGPERSFGWHDHGVWWIDRPWWRPWTRIVKAVRLGPHRRGSYLSDGIEAWACAETGRLLSKRKCQRATEVLETLREIRRLSGHCLESIDDESEVG
jgi:hypothetical protein